MSAPGFTPGPWIFGKRSDGSLWLSLGDPKTGPHYQGDLVASVDDARAIVATRDLYEALDETVGAITAVMRALAEEDEAVVNRVTSAAVAFNGFGVRARAALAKARGEGTR